RDSSVGSGATTQVCSGGTSIRCLSKCMPGSKTERNTPQSGIGHFLPSYTRTHTQTHTQRNASNNVYGLTYHDYSTEKSVENRGKMHTHTHTHTHTYRHR